MEDNLSMQVLGFVTDSKFSRWVVEIVAVVEGLVSQEEIQSSDSQFCASYSLNQVNSAI